MDKLFVIAIGGTGMRCLESFVHLCAMGMFDNDISKEIQKHILNRDGEKVKIYNNQQAAKFEDKNGKVSAIITTNGKRIETDFVVIC